MEEPDMVAQVHACSLPPSVRRRVVFLSLRLLIVAALVIPLLKLRHRAAELDRREQTISKLEAAAREQATDADVTQLAAPLEPVPAEAKRPIPRERPILRDENLRQAGYQRVEVRVD